MFPKDHLIDCSSLLWLWATEGFRESNTDDVTKEDKVEGYLYELIARSLIQVQENDDLSGKPSGCRIHDLLRKFILKKARDQEFVELPGYETKSGRLRRVSFSDAKDIAHNTLSSSLRQIRSLLMFGSDITISTVSTIICGGGIKLMKVLHLEAPLAEFLGEDVTANFFFLRYLRLDLNKKLTPLPSYLGKLVYLETLHLNFSSYHACVELPDEILKLTHLRNLICDTNFGFVLPKEIGRLNALENLFMVNGSQGIEFVELGKLTRLRSLKIVRLHEEDAIHVLASVEKMKHLRLLWILNMNDSSSICSFEEKCPPPPMLQDLRLYAIMWGTPTAWICSLERLQSLDLSRCKIKEESFFEGLQLRLTNLVILTLWSDAIDVAEWCFLPRSFPKLRTLELIELSKLKLIKVEVGAMPCFQTIRFWECPKLKLIKVEEGAMS